MRVPFLYFISTIIFFAIDMLWLGFSPEASIKISWASSCLTGSTGLLQ